MTESWYKEWCPHCDAHNWVCNGDENDLSQIDIEGIKCRKCKKIFPLGEMPYDVEELEDINWEDGSDIPS